MSNKYKVGDKFIIEIESCLKCKDGDLYKIKGFNALVFDNSGLKRLEKVNETPAAAASEIETVIDWSKVAVDTPVMVRNHPDEKWVKRHFAKFEDGKVWTWYGGHTSFTAEVAPVYWNHAKLEKKSPFPIGQMTSKREADGILVDFSIYDDAFPTIAEISAALDFNKE